MGTILLIVVGVFVLAALELWALWALGEHEDRRRRRTRRATTWNERGDGNDSCSSGRVTHARATFRDVG